MLCRCLPLAFLLALPPVASAHGLDMELKAKGGTLTVTLTYDDDSPCDGATVKVLNAANEVVAQGKSDANGRCVFAVPPPGDYLVRAYTEDAHAAEQPLNVSVGEVLVELDTSPRPPRMLYLGLGLTGIGVATLAFYRWGRKKRPA